MTWFASSWGLGWVVATEFEFQGWAEIGSPRFDSAHAAFAPCEELSAAVISHGLAPLESVEKDLRESCFRVRGSRFLVLRSLRVLNRASSGFQNSWQVQALSQWSLNSLPKSFKTQLSIGMALIMHYFCNPASSMSLFAKPLRLSARGGVWVRFGEAVWEVTLSASVFGRSPHSAGGTFLGWSFLTFWCPKATVGCLISIRASPHCLLIG